MVITLQNNKISILYTSDILLAPEYLRPLLKSHSLVIEEETSMGLTANGDNLNIYHFLLQLQNESLMASYLI